MAQNTEAAVQLATANASAFAGLTAGVLLFSVVSIDASSSPLLASPYPIALCWALAAIRAELLAPELITGSSAYGEIGEIGRTALQMVVGGCIAVLALASGVSILLVYWSANAAAV